MKKMLKYVIPWSLRSFLVENRYYFPQRFRCLFSSKKKESDVEADGLPIKNRESWIRKFRKYSYAKPDRSRLLSESFFNASISIIKSVDVGPGDCLLVCVQKNDLIRIQQFIIYHRNLGVKNFVILDNNSTDGSFEWLKQQKDVFLLQTKDQYTTVRREAWINRIFSYFGYNRWYIVLDSDEFLTYEECENIPIADIMSVLSNNKVKRGKALLLDMYAKPYYYKNGTAEDFFDECRFFDTDSYMVKKTAIGDIIQGGPRMRCFGTSSFLMKYPMIYLEEEDLQCSSHFLFPYRKNFGNSKLLYLRHFKFMPGDLEKYIRRFEEKNFSSGSAEYKKYIDVWEKSDALDFYYQGTGEYKSSMSLEKIQLQR